MSEIRLTNTVVVLYAADGSKRFQVDSVVVEVASGGRPVRVHFAGPRGSLRIEMPRTVAFRASAEIHDAMISVPLRRSRA
jgi:hypothetical protein